MRKGLVEPVEDQDVQVLGRIQSIGAQGLGRIGGRRYETTAL